MVDCCVDWEAEEAAKVLVSRMEGCEAEVEECLELDSQMPQLQTRAAVEWASATEGKVVPMAPLQFGTVEPNLDPAKVVQFTTFVLPSTTYHQPTVAPLKEKRAANRAKKLPLSKLVGILPSDSRPLWNSKIVEGTAARSDLTYALAHAAKAKHPNICINNTAANEMVLRRFFATVRTEYDIRNADFNKIVPAALILAFNPLQCEIDARKVERSSVFSARCKEERQDSNWASWWTPELRVQRA